MTDFSLVDVCDGGNKDGVRLLRGSVTSANILGFEAGTTGYRGGDYGHGGRTFFRIFDEGSTSMLATSDDDDLSVELGGDCELDTIIVALRSIALILEASRRGGTVCPSRISALMKAQCKDMHASTYLDGPICRCFAKHFASDDTPKFPFVLDLSGIIISLLYYLGYSPSSDMILPKPGYDSCGIDISFEQKKIRVRCNKDSFCTFAIEKPLGTRGRSAISELQLKDESYCRDVLDMISNEIPANAHPEQNDDEETWIV